MAKSQPRYARRDAKTNDLLCWKMNFVGGELKAAFYGLTQRGCIIGCPVKAARLLRSGKAFVYVAVGIAQETLDRLTGNVR